MLELNLNTTLLSNMEPLSCLGRKGGTAVYLVRSNKSDQFYVLKHISVPESQRQVDALIFTGAAADEQAAQEYYQQVVSDYQSELEQMVALANSPNLDCFRSYEIKPKEDGVGFDVFLMSEYHSTLDRYLAEHAMTQSGAVNLALDLCSALQELRGAGLIHRDVTPSNIYLNSQRHFMLGDLGIAKIEELKFCTMPEAMLSPYSAPELFDLMGNINDTIDIYAVGLILYRIYNGNHAPFEDEKTSAKSADRMRITGQEMPAPMFADYEMAGIIQKACAFQPEERYRTPDAFKEALVEYMKRNQVGDEPITPPIVAEETQIDPEATEEEIEPVQFTTDEDLDEAFKSSFSPDNDMLNSLIESVHRDLENDYTASDEMDPDQMAERLEQAKNRKSRNKWLPTILAIVLVLGIAAAAVWFFFLKPEMITIDSFQLTEQTVDSLTVEIKTAEDPTSFEVVCSDAYGNETRQPYTGEPNTFTGLVSGGQYTISLSGLKNVVFEGSYSVTGATKSTTEVISFTVTRQTVSEIELNFIVDGNEPEEWTVSYGPANEEPRTKTFSGHTTKLTGLNADTEYVINLVDPIDIHLTGMTTTSGKTLPSVSMQELKAVLSSSTATLTWTYSGPTPESWNVTTTGTDGYSDNQVVTDSILILENLKAGETYSILITCDNMEQAASTSITPNALRVLDLTAEINETGGVDVAWTTEAKGDDIQWLVVYYMKGSDTLRSAEQTTENFVTLSGMIPNSTYVIEIQEATGKQVGGEVTTIEIDIPAAEDFTDHGFSKGYMSIWLRPTKEDWTVNDLGTLRTSFSKDERVAFACESISIPRPSEETIAILLVIRDEEGNVVDHYQGEEIWDEMWTRKKYVGELLRTPQEPGVYTLECYFNGKLVNTGAVDFTIKE